jgi:hypothetical protein
VFTQPHICFRCDELELHGGKKPKGTQIQSLSYAQKIRAAMTHVFGRIFELGHVAWHFDEDTGHTYGNPSISEKVSSYMLGLQHRKVRAGEAPTSARAVTSVSWILKPVVASRTAELIRLQAILERLYEFNHLAEHATMFQSESKEDRNLHQWGGPMARRELEAIYTVAFICLLRSDEVLKIKHEHIEIDDENETITLTLPFRKTQQNGGLHLYQFLYPSKFLTLVFQVSGPLSFTLCKLKRPTFVPFEHCRGGLNSADLVLDMSFEGLQLVTGPLPTKKHHWYTISIPCSVCIKLMNCAIDIRTVPRDV